MDHQVFPGGGAQVTVDMVNNPPHYNNHPSGIEVIEITKHLNFCIGNAVKYILRHAKKGTPKQDLEKAEWYIKREAPWLERPRIEIHTNKPWPDIAVEKLMRYLAVDDELPVDLKQVLVNLVFHNYSEAYQGLTEYITTLDS